jgi:hypothetical protein
VFIHVYKAENAYACIMPPPLPRRICTAWVTPGWMFRRRGCALGVHETQRCTTTARRRTDGFAMTHRCQ